MKKEIAFQLADAIESGHYIRGRGTNRQVDFYTGTNAWCIGGVLINLFAQAHPVLAAKEKHATSFMGLTGAVPPSVADWPGLYNGDMSARDNKSITIARHKFRGLQHANDAPAGGGWGCPSSEFTVSWKQIAKWLRTDKNHTLV